MKRNIAQKKTAENGSKKKKGNGNDKKKPTHRERREVGKRLMPFHSSENANMFLSFFPSPSLLFRHPFNTLFGLATKIVLTKIVFFHSLPSDRYRYHSYRLLRACAVERTHHPAAATAAAATVAASAAEGILGPYARCGSSHTRRAQPRPQQPQPPRRLQPRQQLLRMPEPARRRALWHRLLC